MSGDSDRIGEFVILATAKIISRISVKENKEINKNTTRVNRKVFRIFASVGYGDYGE